MPGLFRTGVIGVVLLCVGSGVAAADPVELPPVSNSKPSPLEGDWRISVSLTDMKVIAFPNMAATAFTREGFVTAKATLTIEGSTDNSTDLASARLQLWYQLGCQIDLSQGMSLGENDSGVNTVINGSVDGTGAAGIGPLAAGGSVDPGFLAQVNPGGISEESLGEFLLPEGENYAKGRLDEGQVVELRKLKEEGGRLVRVIYVQDYHVHKDGCGGPVFIRLHARASMGTFKYDNDVDVYSVILPL